MWSGGKHIQHIGMKTKRQPVKPAGCMDPGWRKSRIAARILWRAREGLLQARDYRLAKRLARDPEVENRLIDQALASIATEKAGG